MVLVQVLRQQKARSRRLRSQSEPASAVAKGADGAISFWKWHRLLVWAAFIGVVILPHPHTMTIKKAFPLSGLIFGLVCPLAMAQNNPTQSITEGEQTATISVQPAGELRLYTLTSTAQLRDNWPADKRVEFHEDAAHARLRTGNLMFDGLYALAVHEASQNAVSQVKDWAYNRNEPFEVEAFETGRAWHYIWTRDLAYATHLGLASFDPERAARTLLFKASGLKPTVKGGFANQIVQDTGSGGSYPISTDRTVWALGVAQLLKTLPEERSREFARQVYPFLRDTLEQDRVLVFDPADGLYRGEQSFLDWRNQTYPQSTGSNVVPIGLSKALSVNVANYFALQLASQLAGEQGKRDEEKRFGQWAGALKAAINEKFYDTKAGLYSTYLYTDFDHPVRASRYDLLGESLAILLDVAPAYRAKQGIWSYPTGRYGPPVVWPQERSTEIYHNMAIWPFVTAYWAKAARKADNPEAVNRGIDSLVRGAALYLSNMENLDLVSGQPWAEHFGLQGPPINSHRQIWSVAGYLSMVQDVVFGLETTRDGVRFLPYVTSELRNEKFADSGVIELKNFRYRGKAIDVRVHLPEAPVLSDGVCRVERVELNGKKVGTKFISASALAERNSWDIFLEAPLRGATNEPKLRLIPDAPAAYTIFGPLQPQWQGEGVTLIDGKLQLNFSHPDAANVSFNIYRDGKLQAQGLKETSWTDPDSGDYPDAVHIYAVEAIDNRSGNGNASHLSSSAFYRPEGAEQVVPATQMRNVGGHLVNDHFEDWGKPDHRLDASVTVPRNGRYLIRARYSNGAGPVNSGITCAVKKLELVETGSGRVAASGYFVMPHQENWSKFEFSSVVRGNLEAGKSYSLRLFEDEYSRNMSYLATNQLYTANNGGGDEPYNYVNIAGVHLLRVGG